MTKQLIIDVDGNSSIVVRHSGGFRTNHKRVTTALKHAAKHVTMYAQEYDQKQPIIITSSAAALLATE